MAQSKCIENMKIDRCTTFAGQDRDKRKLGATQDKITWKLPAATFLMQVKTFVICCNCFLSHNIFGSCWRKYKNVRQEKTRQNRLQLVNTGKYQQKIQYWDAHFPVHKSYVSRQTLTLRQERQDKIRQHEKEDKIRKKKRIDRLDLNFVFSIYS